MTNRILMRIDLQNDFVHPHGKLTINAPELIARHQKFADNLQSCMFNKIIDSYDTHFEQTYLQTLEAKNFPPHCIYNSWGWHSAAPLKDNIHTVSIFKSTTNIWNEKNAYDILNGDWQEKEVYLCGVLSDICVRQAMNGLLKRGAKVALFEDLCQGLERQIPEIISDEIYRPYIHSGQLRSLTTAQFFRSALLDKKIGHNLVHKTHD